MEQTDTHKTLLMYDDMAKRLIQDQYLLTALELHLELVEAGQELPRLRDFFSCPSNFELCSKSSEIPAGPINRSLSQTTLDSLDWGRYSEDGERLFDDRVAVLEFELRKAKETIQSLRNNLTEAMAPSDQTSTDNRMPLCVNEAEELKPHQVAMLNFLINEYLVYRGYKMTAITFADENDNQDFDNWDDVGLNIPRPRSLQQWWQEKAAEITPRTDSSCQTEELPSTDANQSRAQLEKEIFELQQICTKHQFEEYQFHKGISSTPLVTPAKKPIHKLEINSLEDLSFYNVPTSIEDVVIDPYDGNPDGVEEVFGNDIPISNFIPQEDAYVPIPATDSQRCDLNATDPVAQNPFDEESVNEDPEISICKVVESSMKEECCQPFQNNTQINEIDEDHIDISNCDRLSPLGASCDLTSDNALSGEFSSAQREEARNLLTASSSRSVPAHLENELIQVCLVEALGTASHLQKEITALNIGECDLINILCQSLHNIAPNIILSKREELLPLLVYSISQQSKIKEREKLLHLLFNLTKKPNRAQRSTILLGLVSLARLMGSACIEAEILPQCWEQLSHKHPERRVLVAQSVGVLAPYTPAHIRSSLLLSMLQQLLSAGEESDPRVMNAAMVSLSLLIAYLNDKEKMTKLIPTVMKSMECECTKRIEPTNSIEEMVCRKHLLYSSLAEGCLHFDVLQQFLTQQTSRISDLVDDRVNFSETNSKTNIELMLKKVLYNVKYLVYSVPYIIVMLYKSIPQKTEDSLPISIPSIYLEELTNLFSDRDQSEVAVNQLYHAYKNSKRWKELDFVLCNFLPHIVDTLTKVEADNLEIVKYFTQIMTSMCFFLGPYLTLNSVQPLFTNLIFIEKVQTNVRYMNKALLVVYIISIICEQNTKRSENLPEMLTKLIHAIATTKCSSLGVEMAIELLLEKQNYEEVILEALWSCVVDSSLAVKIAAAPLWTVLVGRIPEPNVASRVVPALVTLATDSDDTVRSSSLLPLSNILSRSPSRQVSDKITLQLESLCEEAQVLESIALQCAITKTCIALGHNTHPQVLHNIFLPCICRVILEGRGTPEERLKFSTCTLEALKALISASIPNHVVAHFVLPVLNQLQKTLGSISVEYMEEILTLTKEYTVRLQTSSLDDRPRSINHSTSFSSAIGSGLPISRQGVEDVKNTMSKIGRVVTSGVQQKTSINLPNIFRRKQ